MKKNKLSWLLIAILLMAGVGVFKILRNASKIMYLEQNGILTTATVSNTIINFKSHICEIEYSFLYKSKTYKGIKRLDSLDCKQYGDSLIGKQFPLKFDPAEPANNQIMIIPWQFKLMNVPFPDSLKWVLMYYKQRH